VSQVLRHAPKRPGWETLLVFSGLDESTVCAAQRFSLWLGVCLLQVCQEFGCELNAQR
jgi:hypothetical protein